MLKFSSWTGCASFRNWQSQEEDVSARKVTKSSIPEPDGVNGVWDYVGEGKNAKVDQWDSCNECNYRAFEEWQSPQGQDCAQTWKDYRDARINYWWNWAGATRSQ
jgi:hypothetical protein